MPVSCADGKFTRQLEFSRTTMSWPARATACMTLRAPTARDAGRAGCIRGLTAYP